MSVAVGWWAEAFARLNGIPDTSAMGGLALGTPQPRIVLPSIGSAEAFGALTARYNQFVTLPSIGSGEAFGAIQLSAIVALAGITTAEALGTMVFTRGPVTVALPGIPSGETLNPLVVSLQPPTFTVLGTSAAESTGTATASITPTAGDWVYAVVQNGAGKVTGVTYGSAKMAIVGRALFNATHNVSIWRIRNVAGGSPVTITATSTADWCQVQAIAYRLVTSTRAAKVVVGVGTAMSQAVTVASNGATVQAFGEGSAGFGISSPTGGTNRYLENVGQARGTISDTLTATTMAATLASSTPWGGIAVPLEGVTPVGPRLNDTGYAAETTGTSASCTVDADVGDYVYADLHQGATGVPTGLTCAGVAMTLVTSQTFSTYSINRYRSASPMATAGSKTVAATVTGGAWKRLIAYSISGVTTIGATTKTSGAASAPSHAVTLAANQFALQTFGLDAAAASTVAGANIFDNPGASGTYPFSAYADETTTFALGNTSVNWGSIITVLS